MSGRKGHKITLGMLKGKSITTSVPSIAIRFHTGDEEVDIYPSADDEEDDEKEGGSEGGSAGASPPTISPSVTPSIPSRDPSPMKEYLRGLGKRSTSVDGGMVDAGTSSSDTWRIFHELKGKITKTVEEKLTEMKNDRKASSGTPILSSLKNRRRRLRAGGNDTSSISDSEDVSEISTRSESKGSTFNEPTPPVETQERKIKFVEPEGELPSTSGEKSPSKRGKFKKGRSKRLATREKSCQVDGDMSECDTESSSSDGPVVENAEEISEETKFVEEDDYNGIPTVDYRTDPPTTYNVSPISRTEEQIADTRSRFSFDLESSFRDIWYFRYVFISLTVIVLYWYFPLSPYVSGIAMGIFLTLTYHLTVGLTGWYEPTEMPIPTPFSLPHYKDKGVLEVKHMDDMTLTPIKCAGWMNELPVPRYDPDCYHINDTQTVYVRLEGSILRLSHPKSKVQKRAMWNERKNKMKFIHQRIYNIAGSTVKLLPEGLTRKRLWSKKYPICIILSKESSASKALVKLADVSSMSFDEKDEGDQSSLRADSRDVSATFLFENAMENDVAAQLMKEQVSPDPSEELLLTSLSKMESRSESLMETPAVTPSDDETFCHIDDAIMQQNCLFLFARADRQKEDWYRRLAQAVRVNDSPPEEQQAELDSAVAVASTPDLEVFIPEASFEATQPSVEFVASSARETAEDHYIEFMNRFHLQVKPYIGYALPDYPVPRNKFAAKEVSALNLDREVQCDVMWINAIAGHVLYDIMRNEEWILKLQHRIQKKLETIKLPYFMETLILSEVDFGEDVPMIHRASRPVLDDRGLWVDLDVTYHGHVCLTLETKLNLMKLKTTTAAHLAMEHKDEPTATAQQSQTEATSVADKSKSPIYDSDLEDTAETSETEDEDPSSSDSGGKSIESSPSKKNASSGGKGVIRMMNKIVASKYFQQATENKYIKRAMEGVSNTTITLMVEIRGLTGTLVLNLPPPPSDRMWYGFRGNPKIWIKASPKFGERHLNIKHVVSWIEKKLIQEFQKKFVIPNMDDLVIPPMSTRLPE